LTNLHFPLVHSKPLFLPFHFPLEGDPSKGHIFYTSCPSGRITIL
jgi:hypothetical protein